MWPRTLGLVDAQDSFPPLNENIVNENYRCCPGYLAFTFFGSPPCQLKMEEETCGGVWRRRADHRFK